MFDSTTITSDFGSVITGIFIPFIKTLFTGENVVTYILLFSIGLTIIGSLITAFLRR